MIKIFYCNSSEPSVPDGVSEYRYNKILSAKKDSQAMINAARVLAAGFAEFGISEREVDYGFSENGKPFPINFPSVHFSLAHSDNFAIVAFSDKKIGIDCENKERKISSEIITRFFSEREAEAFSGDMLTLWVSKEAAVKLSGKGFALGREDYEIPHFDAELELDNLYLRKLDLEGYLSVLCASQKDEVLIKKI